LRLFRTKIWWWLDIGLLKWSALLFGAIAGAYFSDIVKQYVWVLLSAAAILAIRPVIKYFEDK
jgi:hypothetical protein